jgi:hypothetical protein
VLRAAGLDPKFIAVKAKKEKWFSRKYLTQNMNKLVLQKSITREHVEEVDIRNDFTYSTIKHLDKSLSVDLSKESIE